MTDGRLKVAAARLRRLADAAAPPSAQADEPVAWLEEARAQRQAVERLERRLDQLAATLDAGLVVLDRPAPPMRGPGWTKAVLLALVVAVGSFTAGVLMAERMLPLARPWLGLARAQAGW